MRFLERCEVFGKVVRFLEIALGGFWKSCEVFESHSFLITSDNSLPLLSFLPASTAGLITNRNRTCFSPSLIRKISLSPKTLPICGFWKDWRFLEIL